MCSFLKPKINRILNFSNYFVSLVLVKAYIRELTAQTLVIRNIIIQNIGNLSKEISFFLSSFPKVS